MSFRSEYKPIGLTAVTMATAVPGENLLVTSLIVCNVHPSDNVLIDIWRENGSQRVYIEAGKQLKGDVSRTSYPVPIKAMSLTPPESLKAIAYGVQGVSWFAESEQAWADIDWYGLFLGDADTVVHANLTVFNVV